MQRHQILKLQTLKLQTLKLQTLNLNTHLFLPRLLPVDDPPLNFTSRINQSIRKRTTILLSNPVDSSIGLKLIHKLILRLHENHLNSTSQLQALANQASCANQDQIVVSLATFSFVVQGVCECIEDFHPLFDFHPWHDDADSLLVVIWQDFKKTLRIINLTRVS